VEVIGLLIGAIMEHGTRWKCIGLNINDGTCYPLIDNKIKSQLANDFLHSKH